MARGWRLIDQAKVLQQEKNIKGKEYILQDILWFGNKCSVDQKAIPSLQSQQKSSNDFHRLSRTFYSIAKSQTTGMTLLRAIAITFRKFLSIQSILVGLMVSLAMVIPSLTDAIISYIQDSQNRQLWKGLAYLFAVFMVTFLKILVENSVFYQLNMFGYNLSNTMSLMVYAKSLKYPILSNKKYSIAQIINLSQTDAQRFTYVGYNVGSLIFTPIQIGIGIFFMYRFIGISFSVGIGVMLLAMIATLILTKVSSRKNEELLKAKDGRVKVTQQVFNITKFIKVNALEKYFFERVNARRLVEVKLLKQINLLLATIILIYWISPPLVLASTFATYIFLGNQMTATQAFTTIILFKILQYPLYLLPAAISEVIQVWASVKRLELFLLAQEIQHPSIQHPLSIPIQISNASYQWGLQQKDQPNPKQPPTIQQDPNRQSLLSEQSQDVIKPTSITALKNINLELEKGRFIMVLGHIGSGKSSLLYSILNQMTQKEGCIKVNGSIAFVSQKPWILNATVKDNILFTLPYDQDLFNKVLFYSQLQKDISAMESGIDTQIGEKGLTLSGGQKARIALARALYSNRDIYLLDDVISAVDIHVGKFLIQQTLLKFLKGKTIILATHAISFAQLSEQLILMDNGRITQKGQYAQIKNTLQFKKLSNIQKELKRQQSQDQEQKQLDKLIKVKSTKIKQLVVEQQKNSNVIKQLMLAEDHQKGQVALQVYKEYIKTNGSFLFIIPILLCFSLWLISSTWSNIEIERWCEDPDGSTVHLYVYLSLSIASGMFTYIRATVILRSGVRQGSILHKRIIKALLYASIPKFYNRVPIGRLINRLTKDLGVLDNQLAYWVSSSLVNIFSLVGNLIICVYASTPWILVPMAFATVFCYLLKNYYLKTQRQVVRMDAITTSPIVSGFMSSINGLPTIRAFNLQSKFMESQIEKVDINKRMKITRQALSRWFGVRLSMLSFIVNIPALCYCLVSDNENASLAGLLLTYTLTLNDDLTQTMFSMAYLEGMMVSFERVVNFTTIQPQDGYADYCKNWQTKEEGYNRDAISQGTIEFREFSARYPTNENLVLKNISIKFRAGEKVGLVGRTGAGKSTIINCLLRILDAESGLIMIDGKDIRDFNIKDLRSCITMIEQDPTLIDGTIKENLDPLGFYTEQQLNKLIDECNLRDVVNERGGINQKINNENLSNGEKQLICICRSFFRKNKIVLIDEATANIDLKNDQLIQKIIREKFKDSTVITIAHRLSTLSNSDTIMVLGNGQLLQWGSPFQLLKKQNGIYKDMIEKHQSDYLS